MTRDSASKRIPSWLPPAFVQTRCECSMCHTPSDQPKRAKVEKQEQQARKEEAA